MEIEYIKAKTILGKSAKADPWFCIRYTMNLYRGCQHGCVYCDTRSNCYGIGDLSNIRVKENAINLLKTEIKKIKQKDVIGTGSMNDPYMPIEKELNITRKALEVITAHRFPIHIITKGNLVCRDADLLQEISNIWIAVSFTITTTDNDLAKKIEPFASLPDDRLNAIKFLSKKGIKTGVTLMPMLPWITDSEKNVEDLIAKAHESGASYIIPAFGVTLRDSQRDYYFNFLQKQLPEVYNKYMQYYKGWYSFSPQNHKKLYDIFYNRCAKLGIETQLKPFEPRSPEQLKLF